MSGERQPATGRSRPTWWLWGLVGGVVVAGVAEIVTTEGSTLSATGVTSQDAAEAAVEAEPPGEFGDATAAPIRPPPTPATTTPPTSPSNHHVGRDLPVACCRSPLIWRLLPVPARASIRRPAAARLLRDG
jgi:hypothetical protein